LSYLDRPQDRFGGTFPNYFPGFIYNNLTGTLYFDADGNGAGARMAIASLVGSPDTLAALDFVLS
jgi:hypothetical protein